LTTLTILTALGILETCKAQVLFPDVAFEKSLTTQGSALHLKLPLAQAAELLLWPKSGKCPLFTSGWLSSKSCLACSPVPSWPN